MCVSVGLKRKIKKPVCSKWVKIILDSSKSIIGIIQIAILVLHGRSRSCWEDLQYRTSIAIWMMPMKSIKNATPVNSNIKVPCNLPDLS